ncbi:hypothetical protein [Chthonobacter rhizosphaerae]|uniref:hypothetical protein n=1 Tax=Chthonobacter rhizosphaerae TaxID=2735553 RepID=UPI0015EE97C0|nr:hypothetical protein [Chthonobacter rhizosphaerae]
MGGGKGGGSGKTTTTSKPYLQTEVKNAANQATKLMKAGQPAYFPGQTYVGYSPETEQALSLITQRATNGSPLMTTANKTMQGTLDGSYLSSNPYLDEIVSRSLDDVSRKYTEQVLPGLASNFASSGRYGSGIQQNLTADAIGQLGKEAMGVASGIRYDNYNTERDRQMTALGMAPTYAANDYIDANQLMGVGSAREALKQAELQDEMDRYWYTANAKNNALDQYINRISQLNGGYGTETKRGTTASRAGGLLAGGISALGIASGLGAFGSGGLFGLLGSGAATGSSIPAASTALAGTGARYMLG